MTRDVVVHGMVMMLLFTVPEARPHRCLILPQLSRFVLMGCKDFSGRHFGFLH